MARNQSETVPHPALPQKFHRRMYLFTRAMTIYKGDGGRLTGFHEAVDDFKEHKASFSREEERNFLNLSGLIRADLEKYYRGIILAENDGT